MVRVTKCPVCSKINKIKHNHYNNFVCCSTKFPIEPYQLNKIPQSNSKEPKIPQDDINDKKYTPEDYNYQCGVCKAYFDEFKEGLCPNCGVRLR